MRVMVSVSLMMMTMPMLVPVRLTMLLRTPVSTPVTVLLFRHPHVFYRTAHTPADLYWAISNQTSFRTESIERAALFSLPPSVDCPSLRLGLTLP